MNEIHESRLITKVNSKGVKTKRIKCRSGFKLSSNGKSCVPITGAEKARKKRAIKKALRTKKQGGQSLKNRTNRKRLKALKKRKSFGL